MRLLFGPALLLLASCSHAAANNAETRKAETETADASQHFKEGWENIKKGGRDVAEGVATGAKKAGRAIQSAACPVAADQSRGVYYAKDSPGYENMLSAEKSDVRECFASEAGAREQGYTLVR
jgi:hypothetical protein